ncbi:stage II sporulation protein M [Chloroflexota bacterium]
MNYKWYFLITICLFGIGIVLGLATSTSTVGLFDEEITALGTLPNLLASLPQFSLFVFIFIKNVSAILVSFVLSPFFCLVPVMALLVNGGLIGWVSALVIQEKSLGYLLVGLLPHGIFELPAFIIGEAVALSFGTAVMLYPFKKDGGNLLRANLKQNSRYLIVVIILLLPAALIETFITPWLLRLLEAQPAGILP